MTMAIMAEKTTSEEDDQRTLAAVTEHTSQISPCDSTETTTTADDCGRDGDDDDVQSSGRRRIRRGGSTAAAAAAAAAEENEKSSISPTGFFQNFPLPIDSISEILLFSDFESAVKLSRLSCSDPSWLFRSVWKEMFHRQGFAPSNNQENPNHTDFLEETKYRRKLLRNLTCPNSPSSRRSSISSFALPQSCFRFVPIRPDDVADYLEEDPPPVNFDCDSCLLTTPTSPEYLSFNPFSGKLVVFPSILSQALAPQDFITVAHKERHFIPLEPDLRRRRSNVLHDSDILSLQLQEYGFTPTADNEDIEIEVINLGLECKHTEFGRTVLAMGRQLVNANLMTQQQETETTASVTEVTTWERQQGQGSRSGDDEDEFGSPRICRYRHGFHTMELDQLNLQLLVNPDKENGEGNGESTEVGSTHIHVYPLVPCYREGISDDDGSSHQITSTRTRGDTVNPTACYFPSPITTLNCGEAVTTLACSGESLLVATSSGKLQLYHRLQLKQTFSVAESVRTALQQRGRRKQQQAEMILRTTAAATAPIDTIRLVPHMGMERHGFVTLQHDDDIGNTLLLWAPIPPLARTATPATDTSSTTTDKTMSPSDSSDKKSCMGVYYQVDSVIQLPLLPRRIPKIHYDGRRLIVYGQDHIGFILLVYKVRSPDDDDDYTESNTRRGSNDGSGAGILVSNRLHFAHRIRHAALGGHLVYENIHMSCNERFVVVNTKMGHELVETGAGVGTDGLLVIDLENADTTTHYS